MKKLLITAALVLAVAGTASAQSIDDQVYLDVSEITGGNAFEEGQTVRIDYQAETEVRGTLEFVVNGDVVSSDTFTGPSDSFPKADTFTYRNSPDLGEYEFFIRFESEDGEVKESIKQEFVIVESERIQEQHRAEIDEDEQVNVRFEANTFRPAYGTNTQRPLNIYNQGNEELFVNIQIPNTPDCRIFTIEETNQPTTADFKKNGVFEMLPANRGISGEYRQTVLVNIEMPAEEQLDSGSHRFECQPEVEANNGDTEDLTLVAEPTNSAIIKSLRDIQTSVETGNIGGLPLAGFLVFVLAVSAGLGYAFRKVR